MNLENYFELMEGFDQKSKYHDLDLYGHTMKAVHRAVELGYSSEVVDALLWHDVGKLETITMDEDGIHQHYPEHALSSARIYSESCANYSPLVHSLIRFHDAKITKRFLNSLPMTDGVLFLDLLLKVQECDKFAHSAFAKAKYSEDRGKQIDLANRYIRKATINNRVVDHYNYLVAAGYEVAGIFLQGSQNYNLDYEGSDIDTKAIVLPSFKDFVAGKEPVSTTIILENNEHIDVKDIRKMFECFDHSNINFLEILFTKYRFINPKYSRLLADLFINKERICFYDKKRLFNSCCGMCEQKMNALKHPYPSLLEKIEKFGFDPKQLHHIVRLWEFTDRIIHGESFQSALIPHFIAPLLDLKRGSVPLATAEIMANDYTQRTRDLKNAWLAENIPTIDGTALGILQDVKYNVLKQWFTEQLTTGVARE